MNQENGFNNKNMGSKSNAVIFFVAGLIVLIAVGFLIGKAIFTNKTMIPVTKKDNIKNNSAVNKTISYINPEGGSDNKLAILLSNREPDYVMTFNFDEEIGLPEDYLSSIYQDNLFVETVGNSFNYKLNVKGLNLETVKYNFVESDAEVINNVNNWYLTKALSSFWDNPTDSDIFLKLPSIKYEDDFSDWIAFHVSQDNVFGDFNDDYFEYLTNLINVYAIDYTDGNYKFIDYDGTEVNLSDYTFLNDSIAESLKKYNIYLKKPENIISLQNLLNLSYKGDDYSYYIALKDKDSYNYTLEQYTKFDSVNLKGLDYDIFYLNQYDGSKDVVLCSKVEEDVYIEIDVYLSKNDSIDNCLKELESDIL